MPSSIRSGAAVLLQADAIPIRVDNLSVILSLTPAEQVDETIDDVTDLIDEGTLSEGDTQGLLAKLGQIQRMIVDGRPVQAVVGQLTAFINEVGSLMNSDPPVLSASDGQVLIDATQALIDELTG